MVHNTVVPTSHLVSHPILVRNLDSSVEIGKTRQSNNICRYSFVSRVDMAIAKMERTRFRPGKSQDRYPRISGVAWCLIVLKSNGL